MVAFEKFNGPPTRLQFEYSRLRMKLSAWTRELVYTLQEKSGFKNVIEWRAEGFDVTKEISERMGPIVEIGGPSPDGYRIVEPPDDMYVSNLYLDRKVDFVADGTNLPFKDGSIGAVFASYMEYKVSPAIVRDAARVLETGGILVMRGFDSSDLEAAQEGKLRLKQYEWQLRDEMREALVAARFGPNFSGESVSAIMQNIRNIKKELISKEEVTDELTYDQLLLHGEMPDLIVVFQKI